MRRYGGLRPAKLSAGLLAKVRRAHAGRERGARVGACRDAAGPN